FSSYDPLTGDIAERFLGPSANHLFGTDELGRDVLSRVIHGTRLSLQTAAIALGIGVTAGSIIGLVSGYIGGRTDSIVMRGVDSLMAFPALLLAMTIITALGFGSTQLGIAVGVAL